MAEQKTNADKLISYLEEKWGRDVKCPMCKSVNWHVQDRLFQMTEYIENGPVVGGFSYPIAPVMCTNCGYTAIVNAVMAGLVEKDPPADISDQPIDAASIAASGIAGDQK